MLIICLSKVSVTGIYDDSLETDMQYLSTGASLTFRATAVTCQAVWGLLL